MVFPATMSVLAKVISVVAITCFLRLRLHVFDNVQIAWEFSWRFARRGFQPGGRGETLPATPKTSSPYSPAQMALVSR